MSENFKLYAQYYNLLYGDKDYGAEVEYISNKIKTFAPEAQSILEFGSGTRTHGLLLQKQGYTVFGLERSEYMVQEAKKKGFDCTPADIRSAQLDRRFDAVVSLFHVMSYLTENEDLLAAFRVAHKHLQRDGIFLFDPWYTHAVYAQGAEVRVKRMQNEEIAVTRIAEPTVHSERNAIDVQFTIIAKDLHTHAVQEMTEIHPMRHFSIPEIELLAQYTGFDLLESASFPTGDAPSANTWGVLYILKKKQ